MPHPDKAKPTRRAGTLWSVVIGVIVLTGLAAGALTLSRNNSDTDDNEGSIEVYTVSRRAFKISTTASGELEARNQIEVRSRLDDRSSIVEIVAEGTRVKSGDVLVMLNADEIATEIEEEEARVASARAEQVAAREAKEIQISENESSLRQVELKLEIAQLSLDQWRHGDDVQKRQDLDFAITRSTDELDRLQRKFDQSEELLSEGYISKDEYDKDRLDLKTARADLDKANLAKSTYIDYEYPKQKQQKESDVREAQAELERVRKLNASRFASKDAGLINRTRQLSMREEREAKLRRQLEASTITAETDGLVVYSTSMERNSWRGGSEGPWQIGSEIHPNQLIIVLPDTSEMIAAVRVHESLVGRISAGQDATVKIDAIGGTTLPGHVEEIGVLAETGGWRDPNRREYTIKIRLDTMQEGDRLKPSMRCDAEIVMGAVEDALAIPIQAVFSDGPVRFVYAAEAGRYARVPVSVGRRSDEFAEILAGIDESTRVLLREPSPAETIDRPFSDDELAAVGISRDENGKVVRAARRPAGEQRSRPAANAPPQAARRAG